MTPNEDVARRAGLSVSGRVVGVVTLIQEDRFRLQDDGGRGYLFVLGPPAGAGVQDLTRWSGEACPVVVQYDGPPDLGAVAVRVGACDERRIA